MKKFIAVPKSKFKTAIHFNSTKAVLEFFRLSNNKFTMLLREGLPAFKNGDAYFLDEDFDE